MPEVFFITLPLSSRIVIQSTIVITRSLMNGKARRASDHSSNHGGTKIERVFWNFGKC